MKMCPKPDIDPQKNHVSMISVPKHTKKLVTDSDMIEQKTSPKVITNSEVVRLKDAVESLIAAERTLRDLSSHPRDMSAVVVSAESLRKLDLMLVRIPSRQKNLGDDELSKIKEEAAISVELSKKIKPLVKRISSEEISADELYQAITNDPNPDLARRLLVGATKSQSTVIYDNDILIPSAEEVVGKIALPSKQVHHMRIKVMQLDCERQTVVGKLMQLNESSSIFSPADLGIRSFPVRVPDNNNFFLLSQASALGSPVDVALVIELSVAYRGYSYSGNLISIKDAPKLALKLQSSMNERTNTLFN